MKALVTLAIIGVGTIGSTEALAAPPVFITYPFTVTATSGGLSGMTASGTFTYDTVITPPGGGPVEAVGLLSDLKFTWDGVTYNASTANTGGLVLDSSGLVLSASFGNNCLAGSCGVLPGLEQWLFLSFPNNTALFSYTTVSTSGPGTGDIGTPTCTNANLGAVPCPSHSAPEPPTLALFAVGLIGIGLSRRRFAR